MLNGAREALADFIRPKHSKSRRGNRARHEKAPVANIRVIGANVDSKEEARMVAARAGVPAGQDALDYTAYNLDSPEAQLLAEHPEYSYYFFGAGGSRNTCLRVGPEGFVQFSYAAGGNWDKDEDRIVLDVSGQNTK